MGGLKGQGLGGGAGSRRLKFRLCPAQTSPNPLKTPQKRLRLEEQGAAVPEPFPSPYFPLRFLLQGDLGPFNPGLPVEVPVWLAINLKQRQKCRLVPPEWMDVGELQRERGKDKNPRASAANVELNSPDTS